MVATQCRLFLQQEATEKKSVKNVRWSSGTPEEAAYGLLGWLLCKCAAVCECVFVLPDEICAMAAEGRLFEEASSELMVFHFNNPLVFEGSLPLEDRHPGWRGEG